MSDPEYGGVNQAAGDIALYDPGQRVRVGQRSLQVTLSKNRRADLPWVMSFRPQLSPPSIYTEGHTLRTSPSSKA